MKKPVFILLFVFVFVLVGNSQDVVNFRILKSYTKEQLKNINPIINAKYDVDVYYIEYTTKKINQEIDTASGIFSVPVAVDTKFPILVYEHGTSGSRFDVPSKDDNQLLSAVIGTYGYICAFPDYIGLGISKGFHPYLHPESESWATIDLIKAVKKLNGQGIVLYNDQLFITGYSQGGHSAMAVSRGIQEQGLWQITASAPMSGPYSVSKEMKAFTLSDKEYFFCAYLGDVYLSAMKIYDDLLKDYNIEVAFKPEYAKLIRKFEAEEMSLWDMNTKIISLMKENNGKVMPKRMFVDSIAKAVLTNEEHPINKALKRMDVCDWKPEFPLKMIYCKGDNQVTYRNAVYTDSLMNAKGAANVSSVDVFTSGDHSSCFNFALLKTIQFFGTYQHIGSSRVGDEEIESIKVFPNPNSGLLRIVLPGEISSEVNITIVRMDGRKVYENAISSGKNELDISSIGTGVFFIKIMNGSMMSKTGKLFVR